MILKEPLLFLQEFSKETVERVLELLTTAQRTRMLPPDTFSASPLLLYSFISGSWLIVFLRLFSHIFMRFVSLFAAISSMPLFDPLGLLGFASGRI